MILWKESYLPLGIKPFIAMAKVNGYQGNRFHQDLQPLSMRRGCCDGRDAFLLHHINPFQENWGHHSASRVVVAGAAPFE